MLAELAEAGAEAHAPTPNASLSDVLRSLVASKLLWPGYFRFQAPNLQLSSVRKPRLKPNSPEAAKKEARQS